jgi:bla regulator protein blaR1
MTAPHNFFIPAAVQAMFYCLAEGTVLAGLVWLLLRLVPRRNSGTRFAIWFSTLVAMVLLPFLGAFPRSTAMAQPGHGITISNSVAYGLFYGWLAIAGIGLARVAIGLWQLRRLRKSCVEIDPLALSSESQKVVEQFRSSSVAICSSSRLEVPTAIGLFKPAIVVPSWLISEATPAELEHILLHELAHLRRRDDWTNLAQKIVKAVLFFHPLVWWIERRLTLDREIACDDAVLAQTASPDLYAKCLTHIAEKSFVRRQIALAQAAVSRVRQLSLRVEQILQPRRPATTRLWKPAVPLVTLFAVICMFAAWRTPRLLSFAGDAATPSAPVAMANLGNVPAPQSFAAPHVAARETKLVSKRDTLHNSTVAQNLRTAVHTPRDNESAQDQPTMAWSRETNRAEALAAALRIPEGAAYFASYQETIVTSDGKQPSAQNVRYQLRVLQVRIVMPADQPEKRTTKKI